jgi:hypothetical protein
VSEIREGVMIKLTLRGSSRAGLVIRLVEQFYMDGADVWWPDTATIRWYPLMLLTSVESSGDLPLDTTATVQ